MVTGRSLMDCDPEMVAEGVLGGPRLVLGGQGVMNGEGEGMSSTWCRLASASAGIRAGLSSDRVKRKEELGSGWRPRKFSSISCFCGPLGRAGGAPGIALPAPPTPSRGPYPPAPPPPPQARLPPTLVRVPVRSLLLFPCELSPASLEWSPSPLSEFAGSLPPARHGLLLLHLLRRSLTAQLSARSAQIPFPSLHIRQRSFHSKFKTHYPGDPWRQMHRHLSAQQLLLFRPSHQRLVTHFEKVVQEERKGCKHTMPSKRYW